MDQNAKFLVVLHSLADANKEHNSRFFLSFLFKKYLQPTTLTSSPG